MLRQATKGTLQGLGERPGQPGLSGCRLRQLVPIQDVLMGLLGEGAPHPLPPPFHEDMQDQPECFLDCCYLKGAPGTSRNCITWELIRNAESWAQPQTWRIKTHIWTRFPRNSFAQWSLKSTGLEVPTVWTIMSLISVHKEMVVKCPDSEGRKIWALVLALPLTRCAILGKHSVPG